ncbi:MarR family winged helix-turn-helix transcriptional regulator [Oceanobacillus chungangensis]|uniref:MarR family transcriptional regulator n=1 Tax=Oceanobacillus chungangensis TaxID=1229152 RepID=A0A3D8PJG5_9BACI|nr:MarR family transcriptional regulator [Oceanobacillus chungangensis]RDW16236.1 MarR family transcriptional regulator [Oceanobacillus chungangensis]
MSDNLSLKAFVVLLKASKSIEELIKKDISSHGMKSSDFAVIEAVYSKGKQTIRQISEAVLINTGSITYVIDKLENNGLVERINCKEDRRVVYIQITDKGKELMDEIFPKHQQVIESLFEGISAEEKEIVINVLKKVGKKGETIR